jgi:hypothetical protein
MENGGAFSNAFREAAVGTESKAKQSKALTFRQLSNFHPEELRVMAWRPGV